MYKLRIGILFPLLIEIFIPDAPIQIGGRIEYIKIPPLSQNKDNPISVGVNLGKEADYSLEISYRHITDESSECIFSGSGHAKIFSKTVYFPKDKIESSKLAVDITIRSSVFTNGISKTTAIVSSIVPANVALASNYVTSFQTEANYYYYSASTINKGTNYSENFIFNDFQREQEQSFYNLLDLEKFSISYKCPSNGVLEYKECFMYLQNYDHWFDNLGTTFGNFRKVPLNLFNRNDKYYFELKDVVYVDKTTNRLFSSYQENTLPTKKIFLPKNGFTTDKIQMNLNIKGVGYNEANISQTFLFSNNRNYFGDCYNSEYCISGSEAETNFEFGEIEEH